MIIDFPYFIDEYAGEPIHMLRNNKNINLDWFINRSKLPAGSTLAYSYPLGAGYEAITITGMPSAAIVKAGPYVSNLPAPPSPVGTTVNLHSPTKLSSLMIRATVSTGGVVQKSFYFIIHIHDEIEKIWLGPEKIYLRKGLDEVQFAIMIKYTDGTIAEAPAVPPNGKKYTWSLQASTNGTNAIPSFLKIPDGILSFNTALPAGAQTEYNGSIKVDISNSELFSGSITTGTGSIEIITAAGTLSLVHGQAKNLDENTNVLILGDGFEGTEADQKTFNQYVSQIVSHMKSSPITSPWNHLSKSMNYWSYFLPGREGGGSISGEFVLLSENPVSPTNPTVTYNTLEYSLYIAKCTYVINQLINRTGNDVKQELENNGFSALAASIDWSLLASEPVTSDHIGLIDIIRLFGYPEPMSSITNTTSFADTVKKWRIIDQSIDVNDALYVTRPTFKISSDPTWVMTVTRLNPFVHNLWLKLHKRVSFTPTDTTYSVFRGENTNTSGGERGVLNMDERRISKIQLNKFLSGIKYTNTSEGATDKEVGLKFSDAAGSPGVHADNLIILSRTQPYNIHGLTVYDYTNGVYRIIPVYETNYTEPIVKTDALAQVYKPENIALNALPFISLNAAIHELSHNFLRDEYSDTLLPFPATAEGGVFGSNLQAKSVLATTTPSKVINIEKIKWQFPRILKIAISGSPLTPVGTDYSLSLISFYPEKKQKLGGSTISVSAFEINDIVLLRKRNVFAPDYEKFRVEDKTLNTLILRYLGTNTITAGNYSSGCILIYPRWSTTPGAAYDYQTLIHHTVSANIDTKQQALAEEYTNPADFHKPQLPALDMVSTLTWPANKENIVGLYGGGDNYSTGIYHSTGFCMMRSTSPLSTSSGTPAVYVPGAPETKNIPYTANYFCPVCKYILVDKINPLLHPIIDEEYEKIYPR